MDLASLSFSIDSSQAAAAVQNLGQLSSASGQASQAQQQNAQASDQQTQAHQRLGRELSGTTDLTTALNAAQKQLAMSLYATSQGVVDLTQKMKDQQDLLTRGVAGIAAYTASLTQLKAVGDLIGQSSQSMQKFADSAVNMGVPLQNTTVALQRIAAAMDATSAAGVQLRSTINSIGVSTTGKSTDQILNDVVAQLRGSAASPAGARAIQTVFGTMSPDQQYGLLNPGYVSYAQRYQDAASTDRATRISASAGNADILRRQNDQFYGQLDDLRSNAFTTFAGGGPLGDIFGSGNQTQQLQRMQAIARGTGFTGLTYNPNPGGIQGWWRNFSDRSLISANYDLNYEQFRTDRQTQSFFPAAARLVGSNIADFFGFEGAPKPIIDPRTQLPAVSIDQMAALGQQLGQYGDGGYSGYAASQATLQGLSNPDALAAFQRAYGAPGGQLALTQARNRATTVGRYALTPYARTIDQTNQDAFLQSLGVDQRAFGRYAIGIAGQNGADLSSLKPGVSLKDWLSSQVSHGALGAIQGGFQQQGADQVQAANEALQQTISLQTKLQSVLKDGSAATKDAETYQTTYTKALQDGLDPIKAQQVAQDALNQVLAIRNTTSKTLVSNLQYENDQAKQRLELLGTADPAARAAAMSALGIQQDATTQIRNGVLTQQDQAAYVAQQQQKVVSGVLTGQQAGINDAQDQISQTQRVNDLVMAGFMTQQQATAEIQAQVKAEQDLATVRATGNQQALKQLQDQIMTSQQLRDLQRQIADNQAATNIMTGNVMTGGLNADLATMPPSQRQRYQTLYNAGRQVQQQAPGLLGQFAWQQLPGASAHIQDILTASQATGVPAAILAAIGAQESGNGTDPASLANGDGAFQITPGTATSPGYGISPWDHSQANNYLNSAIFAGNYMTTKFNSTYKTQGVDWSDPTQVAAALTGYNGGGDPLYSQHVLGRLQGLQIDPSVIVGAMNPGGSGQLSRVGQSALFSMDSGNILQNRRAQESSDLANSNIMSLLQAALSGNQPWLAQLRLGQSSNPEDPLAASNRMRAQVGGAYQTALSGAQQLGSMSLDASRTNQEIDAVRSGQGAVQALQNQFKDQDFNNSIQAAIEALQAYGGAASKNSPILKDLQDEMAAYKNQLDATTKSQNELEVAQQTVTEKQQNQSLALQVANPFASDQQMAALQMRLQERQLMAKTGLSADDPQIQDKIQTDNATLQLQKQKQQVDDLKQSYDAMGNAIGTAFDQLLEGGQSGHQVLQTLFKDIENIAINAAINKPLSNLFSNLLGSVTGGGGSAASAVSGAATSAAGSGIFGGLFSWLGLAAGGAVMDGRVIPMASGGVIDRTTIFPMAAGGAVMGGEISSEGLVPLRRLANGDLGVQTAGSGGGNQININSPITVNGGQGQNGKMDPTVLASMQQELRQTVYMAVKSTIADEQRPGGTLYAPG